MLDEDFCEFLEYHLTEMFSHSDDTTVKGFWCDGIILPVNEKDYSKKNVNDNREILLNAFIGKDGQNEYVIVMKLGNKSLSRYARDLDIKDCMPKPEETDWYTIDIMTKKITIQLL